MKAFLECGNCGKHSSFVISGVLRCPHCASDKVNHMVIGNQPPDWFRESVKRNFINRLLDKIFLGGD